MFLTFWTGGAPSRCPVFSPPCPWLLSVTVLQHVNGPSTSSQLDDSWQEQRLNPKQQSVVSNTFLSSEVGLNILVFHRSWPWHLGMQKSIRLWQPPHLHHSITKSLSENSADSHRSFTVRASTTSSFSYQARPSVSYVAIQTYLQLHEDQKPEECAHIMRTHRCFMTLKKHRVRVRDLDHQCIESHQESLHYPLA